MLPVSLAPIVSKLKVAHTTKTYSDAELLNALAGSSDAAFTMLYNKYWEKIYQVADFYLQDKSMVEDVVQEVFLIIWKKRTELLTVSHFPQYVGAIARNLIISSLRKKMPVRSFSLEYAHTLNEVSLQPALELEYKETSGLIEKAVNQLSPRQKEIYLMSNDKQLSLKETAVRLNISYDSVRQHKSEALKLIRRFLKKTVFSLFGIIPPLLFFPLIFASGQ